MKTAKITFILNGRYASSVFHYRTEDEKNTKLKKWKEEHLTKYNSVTGITYNFDYYPEDFDRVTSPIK